MIEEDTPVIAYVYDDGIGYLIDYVWLSGVPTPEEQEEDPVVSTTSTEADL